MKTAQRKWVCSNCGRRNKTVAAVGGAMTCEYCNEVTSGPVVPPPNEGVAGADSRRTLEDTRKRGVVARLRQRYGEARVLSWREEPDLLHSAHLEWILGAQRDLGRDEAAFDSRVSELVVLWLQDYAQQLDELESLPPAADSRQAVARGLRTATRDFAEAFLGPRLSPAGQP